MNEHTAGPWTCRINAGNWSVIAARPVTGNYGGWRHCAIATRIGGPDAEQEANARLIAAAPELLEALQDLLAAATAEVNEKGGGGFILARMTDARAAIAKATSDDRVSSRKPKSGTNKTESKVTR